MNNDYQNTPNYTELENMRQQMNTLKKKLEQQEIVNDQMIRRSMKATASNINRTYLWLMAIGILMVPYGYWAFVILSHFSIAFWIATSILMLVSTVATYYNKRNVSDANLMTNNLVDVRRRMARAKKFDADWLFFGIPAIILWLAWFFYEVYKQNIKLKDDDELQRTLPMLKLQLKALIARDLWDMSEYYSIINEDSDIVRRALEVIAE